MKNTLSQSADLASSAKAEPFSPIVSWSDSPIVRSHYIYPLLSGSGATDWFEWVSKTFFPHPVNRALSLGCGTGELERRGLALDVAMRFDACDASPDAIDLARRTAQQYAYDERLHYFVSDLNKQEFSQSTYDVVFATKSLQHTIALEHLFAQIERTLKPGGLFVMSGYVGPDQFQWTDKQVKYAQQCLDKIPESYRRSVLNKGIKVSISRPSIASINEADPTAAIHSKNILPLLYKHFDVLERRDYGGTLLNLVLEDIAGNFQEAAQDIAILKELFDFEQKLIRAGELTSDFTAIVAYRR